MTDFFLARLPLFKGLPDEALKAFSRFQLKEYGRGETVFSEGEAPSAVFLLKTGLVKASKLSPAAELATMELITPGRLFGIIAVLDRRAYPVNTIALQDSEAYRIPAAVFDELMKQPEFARRVYAEMGSHLRHGHELRSLAREPVERRLAYVLWLLAEAVGPDLKVRREDVAQMAGSTPETAMRVITAFAKRKLVSTGWKRIKVLDLEALRKESGV